IDIISGLSEEVLNWRPESKEWGSGYNSLAVLAAHIVGAERRWAVEVIGGTPINRDRPAEFATVSSHPSELIASLESVGKETRQVLEKLTAEELGEDRQVGERIVAIRWVILHLIDHISLHFGHMQITYQLFHKGKAHQMPR
ncbi:MAG: DinB family protein, partial [Chloroflexota bacterium]